MIPMTMCDVKGFAYSAGTTDNYHPIPHFPSTIRSILVSFSIVLVLQLTALLVQFSST